MVILYTLVDIIFGQYIYNKILNLHRVGETDGNRYDVIFIMVIFLKSCGARNDKSPEAVACTPEPVPGRDGTHYKYEPSDLSVSK